MKEYSTPTLRKWINEILDTGKDLTEWEDHFVKSVDEQLGRVGKLSPRQQEILEGIYANKTK